MHNHKFYLGSMELNGADAREQGGGEMMGLISKLLEAFNEEPKIGKDFLAILKEKGIRPYSVARMGVDAYEFRAREIELFGNGETEKMSVDRIMFGYGDTYITAFGDFGYREIEAFLVKGVEV